MKFLSPTPPQRFYLIPKIVFVAHNILNILVKSVLKFHRNLNVCFFLFSVPQIFRLLSLKKWEIAYLYRGC